MDIKKLVSSSLLGMVTHPNELTDTYGGYTLYWRLNFKVQEDMHGLFKNFLWHAIIRQVPKVKSRNSIDYILFSFYVSSRWKWVEIVAKLKKKKKNAKLISLRSGWTWNQLYELANSQNRIEGSLIALQFLSLLFQISGNVCYK